MGSLVDPPVTEVLIEMEGTDYVDLEGADALNMIVTDMKGRGVTIHLARVKNEAMTMLEQDSVDQTVGHENIHDDIDEAVKAFQQESAKRATANEATGNLKSSSKGE